MRSRTRVIVAAVVFSLVVLNFLRLKGDAIPNYLPQEAHDYLYPQGHTVQQAGQPGLQPAEKPDTPNEFPPPTEEPKPVVLPEVTGEATPSSDPAETELDQRLQSFLELPILSYDDAVAANAKTCPTDGINFDRSSVVGNADKWANISAAQIAEWRQEIVSHMRLKQNEEGEKAAASTEAGGSGGGRGIVMAAGDHSAAIRARTNIRLLASYDCALPVEIFHFPDELSAADKKLLLEDADDPADQHSHKTMKVTLRAVEGIEKGGGWKQFQIKGAAIQQSSFDEILYLDTDSYLLRNPDYVFESPQWNGTRLLLWPDYAKSHPTNPLWRLLGQPCRNEYEGESGQIFLSRSRHQDLMWLVEFFAMHHDEYYGFMGGDRESFRAAALLLGKPWAGPGRINAAAGVGRPGDAAGGGHTMLQADPEGRWLFVHANLIKHGRFPRPLWSRIQRAAQDRFAPGTTYGSIEAPNDKVGDGVKFDVVSAPRMATAVTAFEGYSDSALVVEDWDSYEELKGFEEKWFGFGGVH